MLFFINQTFFIISFKKNLISTLFSSLSTSLPHFWVRKGKHSFPSNNTLFLSFFHLFFYSLIYREVRKGRKQKENDNERELECEFLGVEDRVIRAEGGLEC